jgi:acyl dehydratase
MTSYSEIKVGDEIPALANPPISRHMLALYAGASGDHNPIHVDLDFARKAGMPDVFAHGMLGMAWLGRLLTQWVPQAQLRTFEVRFQGITHLGHAITCRGRVAEKLEHDGEKRVALDIETVNQYGQIRIAGRAIVALP